MSATRRRSVPREVPCAALLLFAVSSVRAQPVDAPSAQDEPDSRRVIFVLPELDAEADAQLRDALLAQFTLVEAELAFAPPRAIGRTQPERLAALRSVAGDAAALAAFYLDVEAGGRWLLYTLDHAQQHMVVRALDARGPQRAAAIEAVAVMTRESTRALLEGAPLPEPPEGEVVAERPEPATVATPRPAPAARAAPAPPASSSFALRPRFALAYVATTFDGDSGVRHGVWLGLGHHVSDDLRVGLGVDLTPAVEHTATPSFEVKRIPVRAHGAARLFGSQELRLELEGGLFLESLHRASQPTAAPGSALAVSPTRDKTQFVWGLSARAHGELRPTPGVALFVAAGLDLLVNPFDYFVGQGEQRELLLLMHWLRPVAVAGVAFSP